VLSWFISPIIGGILAFSIFKLITLTILHRPSPLKAAKKVAPVLIGFTLFLITFLFSLKTIGTSYLRSLLYGVAAFAISFFISWFLIVKYASKNGNEYQAVEGIFKKVQIITSSYVCFSHGANDVANAVGPIALILTITQNGGSVKSVVEVPRYILLIGGFGIALGVSLYGYKVMQTLGHDITEINNTRGFSIDFGTATTVLLSSVFGFPVSTTHTVVGAVTGVGLARGIEVINTSVLKDILISWFITLPFSIGVSAIFYLALTTFF